MDYSVFISWVIARWLAMFSTFFTFHVWEVLLDFDGTFLFVSRQCLDIYEELRRNAHMYVAITTAEHNDSIVGYSSHCHHNVTTLNKTAAHEKYTFSWVRHFRLMDKYPLMTFISPWVTHHPLEFPQSLWRNYVTRLRSIDQYLLHYIYCLKNSLLNICAT